MKSPQNQISVRFVQCVEALLSSGKVPSARQLALSVDYKPQGLNEILNGKRNAPQELVRKVSERYHFNLRYLFFGDGDYFDLPGKDDFAHTRVVIMDQNQRERIVHVPVAAYAGYRDNLTEPVYIQDLPTYSLPDVILRTGSYRSFDVMGNSMEPTIYAGDRVIGAFVEPQYWEQAIKDHGVYVLITHQEILVKRVLNLIRSEGVLEIQSDNHSYLPLHLSVRDLKEVWVVRLRISARLHKGQDQDTLNEIREAVMSLTGKTLI